MGIFGAGWGERKRFIFGLVAGLLLGPLISGLSGWQVSKAFNERSVHDAVVAQDAAFCEVRARAAVKDPGKLEYQARYALAEQWSKMPGQTKVDDDVVTTCTNNLAG